MPKPTYPINEFTVLELKKKVSTTAGFPIWTKPDCAKLSSLILDKTHDYLSEATLYRMFIAKNENRPYKNTLDVLSKYSGCIDYYDFELKSKQLNDFDFSIGKLPYNSGDSLLKICIHQNELKSLYKFAEQVPDYLNSECKHRLGMEFYSALLENPNDNDEFFKNFHTLPIIRESLIEMMADPEFKLKGYERGLQFYLQDVSPENSAKELQDFVFANAILFRHYFVTGRYDEAKRKSHLLYNEYSPSVEMLNQFHVFPRSRFLAYKIWHFSLNEMSSAKEKYEEEILDYCIRNIENWTRFDQRVFFYNLAETAIFCKTNKTFEKRLKQIFHTELANLPEQVEHQKLSKILPYIQENGVLFNIYLESLKTS